MGKTSTRPGFSNWLTAVSLLLLVAGCSSLERNGQVLFATDFSGTDDLASTWHWEGRGRIGLDHGRLALQEENGDGLVLWLRQDVPEDMRLQFDLSFSNNRGIGVFFVAAKGTNGEDILTGGRDGKYNLYTKGRINCYGISLHRYFPDGRHNPGSNIRKNSGFHRGSHAEPDPVPEANRTYRIKMEKRGNRLRLWVDGNLVHDWIDDGTHGKPLADGKIGFRIRGDRSCIMYLDNIVVSSL